MSSARSLPKLQHPIVLVHGLGARASYGPVNYFFNIPTRLRVAGNQIFVPKLTMWDSIEKRAEQLKKQIERRYRGGEKVNLIGHSMGGLDARYLASRLEFSDRVASVTTIGTPNRGTSLSDLALGKLTGPRKLALQALMRFFRMSRDTFSQLTTEHCQGTFNQKTQNAQGVAYFSAASRIRGPLKQHALPVFWLTHGLLKKAEGDNDGFVSVESAQWGEHIVTAEGDHYAQIGQILGRSRGLDHYAFFRTILGRLKDEGF